MTEFGDQRVVRRAVDRYEKIKEKHHHKKPDAVHPRLVVHRCDIGQHRHDRERNGRFSHERDPASVRIFTAVRQISDPGIRHGVKDTPERVDRAENRDDSENHPSLRDEDGLPRVEHLLVRLIERHDPVREDRRHQRPAELPDREAPDYFAAYIFHFYCPLLQLVV